MLRLRSCIPARLLSPTFAAPIAPLHRLLSAAVPAPNVSPNPSFAVEQYLVDACGLSRAQAVKASAKVSHIKSPTKPGAVLAFLAGLGLSGADVAALVAKDPLFLCAKVEGTLAPNVAGLAGLGVSRTEIARLVSLAPGSFRCKSVVSNLPYYLSLFGGSYENLLRALRRSPDNLLSSDLETVVKPNVAFLTTECVLDACEIAKLCILLPRLLNAKPECLQAMVACADDLGVPRGSAMFRHTLHAVAFLGKEKIAARVECLKNTFNWSDTEVSVAVLRAPSVLRRSNESLQRMSEFLIDEVGLEPAYVARRPVLLTLSLEGRLRPRYHAVKFLKENGLLANNWRYDTIVKLAEKVFVEKFICPHKEAAPHLTEDYAVACRGEVPARFIFA